MKKNPWLEINISDYVNHMSSPEVGQYQLINQCFRSQLQKYNPEKIFVPGCTIGNGFEYIEWDQVQKVTALDINPVFLEILRNKFAGESKLETISEDFQIFGTNGRKYDLIFAALFFEYVGLRSALRRLKKMMNTSSVLFSIIQLPGEHQSKVSETKYRSLEKLSPYITLLTAEEFENELIKAGLRIRFREHRTLKNGKSFLLTESFINYGEKNGNTNTE